MRIVVQILGVLVITAGIVYLLKPDVLKRFMQLFKQGKRLYFVALLRFILAIVFLLAARECDIPWVIAGFGILFLISGLLIFIIGLKKLKSMLEWYLEQPAWVLRLIAVIALALGAIIVYSA